MTDAGRSFWNGIIDQNHETIPSLYHQPQTGRPIDSRWAFLTYTYLKTAKYN